MHAETSSNSLSDPKQVAGVGGGERHGWAPGRRAWLCSRDARRLLRRCASSPPAPSIIVRHVFTATVLQDHVRLRLWVAATSIECLAVAGRRRPISTSLLRGSYINGGGRAGVVAG